MKHKSSSVVLVFSTKGELALQKRAVHDDSYPLHWDFSAAGGIHEDEDPKEAAAREWYEELGVGGILEFVEEARYQDEKGDDTLMIYRTIHNGPFKPDKKEVASVKFFTLETIDEKIRTGEKFHPEFIFLWDTIKKADHTVASDIPQGVGAPARHALASAGIRNLKDMERYTEDEIVQLHGMGPKALKVIKQALSERRYGLKQQGSKKHQ